MAKIVPNPAPKGGLNPAFKDQVKAGRTFFGTGRTNAKNQPAKAPAQGRPTETELLRKGQDVGGVPLERKAVATGDLVGNSGGYRLGSATTIKPGFAPSDPRVKNDPGVQAGRRRPDRQNTQDFEKTPVSTAHKPAAGRLTQVQKNSARQQALSKNTVTFTRREGSK